MENDAYPELTDLNIRLQELESQGYTVFPEYLDRDTTVATCGIPFQGPSWLA